MDGKSLLNMSLLEFITKYCTWVGSVNNRSKTGGFETLLPKCPLKGEGKGGRGGVGVGVGVGVWVGVIRKVGTNVDSIKKGSVLMFLASCMKHINESSKLEGV